MNLYEKILFIYPDLKAEDFYPATGVIGLTNNSDGKGDFIEKWDHPTYPKPTDEQLNSL